MRNPFKRARKGTKKIIGKEKGQVPIATPAKADSTADAVEGRLVVMGNESMFSDKVIDYAIDMARRMSFEILALNSAPLSCDSFGLLSASQKKLCEEFESISEKNAMAFRRQAEANGIPFTHVIKFEEPEAALSRVQLEYGNIEFVISEPQAPSTADRVTESNRARSEVLVYSMI